MTPQQIVGLGVRIFAIWLVVSSFRYISLIPYNLLINEMDKEAIVSSMIGVGYLMVALLTWFFPMTISNKIIPKTDFENRFNTRPDEVACVAVSILGLWKTIDTIPALTSYLFQANLNAGTKSLFASLDTTGKSDVIFMLIELVIALILLIRARKIGMFLFSIKQNDSKKEVTH
jgi:hypothetical protein